MKTNRLTLIVAAGIVIPASAFTIYSGSSSLELKGRNDAVKTETLSASRAIVAQNVKSLGGSSRMVVKVAPNKAEAENPYAQYGELIPVLEEDFSKMATGSKGSPDYNTQMWNDKDPDDEDYIPWTNMKPEYTQRPNWGGSQVYPAGGMVYIDQTQDYTHINTPYDTDLSANNGICVLKFDVYSVDDETSISGILIEGGETHNMGPHWDFLESQMTDEIAPGKHTVTCLFYGAGPTTLFNIVPRGQEAFYMDNLTIYTLKQHVATPVPTKHSEYKGTSFKANWDAVDGAESYLVSVYSIENTDEGQVVKYVFEDKPAKENSLVVEGVESGVTYYYTVKSVKGEYTSLASVPMRVFDVEFPKMKEPVVAEDQLSYKAAWDAAPMAERYNYIAYRLLEAEVDGPFVIADEKFTGITDYDGISSDWSFDDPDPDALTYDDFYIGTGMQQRGWHAKNSINYYNSLCIDAFHYFYGNEDSGLISPELDLSKDGGKFTISLTAAGEFFPAELTGVTDLSGNPVDLQVEAAVAVFNYDETLRDFVQSELVYAHDVNKDGMSPNEMRSFTFNLTKGTKRSIIGIYAVGGPGNLYIDDFKVVQNYKAGETFYDPFEFQHWYDGKEVEVNLPLHAVSYEIYDQVQAVRAESNGESADYAVSEFSPLALVFKSTLGVEELKVDDNTTISLNADELAVNTTGLVSVYSVDGSLIASSTVDGTFTCTLPAKGIYLVKTAGKTVKVIY